MYMYEKKSTKGKATAVILMTMILILISGFFIANSTLFNNKPVLPVNQPDAVASLHIPVVLPADETVAAPFAINPRKDRRLVQTPAGDRGSQDADSGRFL